MAYLLTNTVPGLYIFLFVCFIEQVCFTNVKVTAKERTCIKKLGVSEVRFALLAAPVTCLTYGVGGWECTHYHEWP